jgi:hypothetical protein
MLDLILVVFVLWIVLRAIEDVRREDRERRARRPHLRLVPGTKKENTK